MVEYPTLKASAVPKVQLCFRNSSCHCELTPHSLLVLLPKTTTPTAPANTTSTTATLLYGDDHHYYSIAGAAVTAAATSRLLLGSRVSLCGPFNCSPTSL